jgi:hypothetical protein
MADFETENESTSEFEKGTQEKYEALNDIFMRSAAPVVDVILSALGTFADKLDAVACSDSNDDETTSEACERIAEEDAKLYEEDPQMYEAAERLAAPFVNILDSITEAIESAGDKFEDVMFSSK